MYADNNEEMNEENNVKQQFDDTNTTNSTHSTDSTDSGIIIIDKRPKTLTKNNNNHKNYNENVTNTKILIDNKSNQNKLEETINQQYETLLLNNNIEIQNAINSNHKDIMNKNLKLSDNNDEIQKTTKQLFDEIPKVTIIDLPPSPSPSSPSPSSPTSSSSLPTKINQSKENSNKNSPTISIRSTTISIISIDENAIDSSVIDSDSDNEAYAEGKHNGYVVKKLGQQITYEPDNPNLPNINKGLSIVSQTVNTKNSQNSGPVCLAENLINGGLCAQNSVLASNASPQIGSIALTNSSDVTFGDKHFYEGPVTIQQFLIDSRDKWKKTDENDDNCYDNPEFANQPNTTKQNDDAANANNADQLYKFYFNRKAAIITGIIIILTILTGILFIAFKPTTKSVCDENLCMIERDDWGARSPSGKLDNLTLPTHRVIISHTASDSCDSLDVCSYRLQIVQNFHMDSQGWSDIGYNFLVGGDGNIYRGRGWDKIGAHTKGYNTDSIGISFTGTYTATKPTEQQLKSLQLLLEDGVRLKKLAVNYKLFGHRQFAATESPGDALYNIIKTWPHWSKDI